MLAVSTPGPPCVIQTTIPACKSKPRSRTIDVAASRRRHRALLSCGAANSCHEWRHSRSSERAHILDDIDSLGLGNILARIALAFSTPTDRQGCRSDMTRSQDGRSRMDGHPVDTHRQSSAALRIRSACAVSALALWLCSLAGCLLPEVTVDTRKRGADAIQVVTTDSAGATGMSTTQRSGSGTAASPPTAGASAPSTPMTSTPMTSTPMTSTPMTSTPMTSTPMTSTPMTQPGPVRPALAPVIPQVNGACPTFVSSTITLMGLAGIQIVAGTKPAGATAPFVFYWHALGSSADEFIRNATAVRDGVVAEGGVLVSFQGSTGGDSLSGGALFGAGDFAVGDQLVACAVRDHNVDPSRIFATGCSFGALFSAAQAAQRSGYLAAVATNSGGWASPVAFQTAFTPGLMTIHGVKGTDVVIVDFSETSARADAAFKQRGGFVINCDHGGSHCGGTTLARDVWQFFRAHPYGVSPEPWQSALPSGFSPVCKIY
jgi:hypothetical protein